MPVIPDARFVIGCAVPLFGLGATSPEIPLEPPSSSEPPGETVRLSFEHVELRARQCEGAQCWPDLVRRAAVASLQVEAVPIPAPRLGRKDEREIRHVAIPAGRTPGRASLTLAPGEWEFRVPAGRPRRVRLGEADSAVVRIWTVLGRCVQGQKGCLLDARHVRRRIWPPQP